MPRAMSSFVACYQCLAKHSTHSSPFSISALQHAWRSDISRPLNR